MQQLHTKKEDSQAPIVAQEALLLSCDKDEMESQDVATIHIPGTFMQADVDEKVVHLCIHRKMADPLAQLAPKLFRKDLHIMKNKPILYVVFCKSLYGTLSPANLFRKSLSDQLIKRVFHKPLPPTTHE